MKILAGPNRADKDGDNDAT